MGSYEVVFAKSAIKELGQCPQHVVRRAKGATDRLSKEPRHRGIIKLSGTSDLYRLRIGDYRFIYEIDDSQHLVTILAVRHRREAYQ